MVKQLIFDVGAHCGDDSFVYLEMGFKVIAIEANSFLVEEMQSRFHHEISRGDLVLLNVLVSDKDNARAEFYLQSDSSKSSVVPLDGATRIEAETRRLDIIVQDHGTPTYCKIDIEDADLPALKSLGKERPPFVSVEVSGKSVSLLAENVAPLFNTIDYLYEMGYHKFKLVDQESLTVLTAASHYRSIRTLAGRVQLKMQKKLGLFPRDIFRRRFHLPGNAELSGYPSALLPGSWITYEKARDLLYFHFREYCSICSDPSFIFWVDVHASM